MPQPLAAAWPGLRRVQRRRVIPAPCITRPCEGFVSLHTTIPWANSAVCRARSTRALRRADCRGELTRLAPLSTRSRDVAGCASTYSPPSPRFRGGRTPRHSPTCGQRPSLLAPSAAFPDWLHHSTLATVAAPPYSPHPAPLSRVSVTPLPTVSRRRSAGLASALLVRRRRRATNLAASSSISVFPATVPLPWRLSPVEAASRYAPVACAMQQPEVPYGRRLHRWVSAPTTVKSGH